MESRFAQTSFFPGCKQVLERGHGGQHPREHVKERGYSTTGMNTSTSRNLVDRRFIELASIMRKGKKKKSEPLANEHNYHEQTDL